MQGRKNQVPGLGCLDRNVCCFEASYFSDHDDVRILTKKRPQRHREIEFRLLVDRDLVDTRNTDFDGIFYTGDVDVRIVQHVQGGVQRHGFTAAGRTGDKNHAVRSSDGFLV